MEKRPLKGNGSSIPLSVPATYQSVGDKVSLYFSFIRKRFLPDHSYSFFQSNILILMYLPYEKFMVWLGFYPAVHINERLRVKINSGL